MNNEVEKTTFERLHKINVKDKTKKKNGLTYLSWASAWAETKEVFPTANYEIKRFGENQLPYVYDEATGYMVFTSVNIDGLTHDMWLAVMDSKNKAMKSTVYTYDTTYKKDIRVEAATMCDINNAIMRCLVKNLAMFGLALNIYEGEDFPEEEETITVAAAPKPPKAAPNKTVPKAKKEDVEKAIIKMNEKYPEKSDKLINNICATYQISSLFELTDKQLKEVEAKL